MSVLEKIVKTKTANHVSTIIELNVVRVFNSTLLATSMGEQGSKLEKMVDLNQFCVPILETP